MPNKKIVFVTYGGGHVNMLVPIIKELQKQDNLELVVLGLTTAGSVLKNNNIPYIRFKDLLKDNENALKWGKKLVNKNDLHDLVSYEESVAYMGLNYVDLEIEYGKEEAGRIYLEQGRQAFNPISTMEKFLEEESPDLLVATNSPRAERAAIRMAHKLNIPSICLNDLFAIQEVKWLKDKNYATKVCVFSEDVKSYIVAHGRPKDDVVVTGNPAFDNLLSDSHQRKNYRDMNNWSKSKKVILWASQPEPFGENEFGVCANPELPRIIEKQLLKVIRSHDDWHLVIRRHPSEDQVFSRVSMPNVTVSPQSESLNFLLQGVDTVVTMYSTVGIQAAILGKNVVSIDMSVYGHNAPFSQMGISYGVDSLNNLEGAIIKVNEASVGVIDMPRNATRKIINIIQKLTSLC